MNPETHTQKNESSPEDTDFEEYVFLMTSLLSQDTKISEERKSEIRKICERVYASNQLYTAKEQLRRALSDYIATCNKHIFSHRAAILNPVTRSYIENGYHEDYKEAIKLGQATPVHTDEKYNMTEEDFATWEWYVSTI